MYHLDRDIEDSSIRKVESYVAGGSLDSLVTIDRSQADSRAVMLVSTRAVLDPFPYFFLAWFTLFLHDQEPTRNSFSGYGFENLGIFGRQFPVPAFPPVSRRFPRPRFRR